MCLCVNECDAPSCVRAWTSVWCLADSQEGSVILTSLSRPQSYNLRPASHSSSGPSPKGSDLRHLRSLGSPPHGNSLRTILGHSPPSRGHSLRSAKTGSPISRDRSLRSGPSPLSRDRSLRSKSRRSPMSRDRSLRSTSSSSSLHLLDFPEVSTRRMPSKLSSSSRPSSWDIQQSVPNCVVLVLCYSWCFL